MSFCMLKRHNNYENSNVNKLFFQTITEMGWTLSKKYKCGWSKGPSVFWEYVKNEHITNVTLLVEIYTYHREYDEYHLSMSAELYNSDKLNMSYYIPKDLYDLVIGEIDAIDFFCGSMGLEINGFESLSSNDRYDVNNLYMKYLNDTLYDIAYISEECAKSCYDILPKARLRYDDIKLKKGNLYIRKGIMK